MATSSSSSASASAAENASSKAGAGLDLQRFVRHSAAIGSFISALDEYEPTIPEQVARYYMQKSGVEGGDVRMAKLLSLAADNFLAKTIYEARQMSLLRTQVGLSSKTQSKAGQKRKVSRNPQCNVVWCTPCDTCLYVLIGAVLCAIYDEFSMYCSWHTMY